MFFLVIFLHHTIAEHAFENLHQSKIEYPDVIDLKNPNENTSLFYDNIFDCAFPN